MTGATAVTAPRPHRTPLERVRSAMHAILATMGTDGDVFPYLGLGRVLRARGHRVTLAGPEPYRGRATALVSMETGQFRFSDGILTAPFPLV